MNFYDKTLAGECHDVIDLSTGNPRVFEKISYLIKHSLSAICNNNLISNLSWKYGDYDGLPVLKDTIRQTFSLVYRHEVAINEIVITPGVQNTLRYFHNLCEAIGKKIFLPFHLDFPGAFPLNQNLLTEQSMSGYISSDNSFDACMDETELEKIDWKGIGFVILSNPHNPTGSYFKEDIIRYLHEKMLQNNAYLIIDHTYDLPYASMTSCPFEHYIYGLPNIVNLYSFSKIGLASERVAFAIGKPSIISGLRGQMIRNIIQSPKIGQLIAADLFTNFKYNEDIQQEIRDWYNSQWVYAKQRIDEIDPPHELIKVILRGGGPFIYMELNEVINASELQNTCKENGLLITSNFDITPILRPNQLVRNGIRIGLTRDRHELEAGLFILQQSLNLITERLCL